MVTDGQTHKQSNPRACAPRVNRSKKSCLLYSPAISPLGTVATKRLNAGLTSSWRGLPLGPGRSLHLLCIVMKAKVLWSIFLSLSEGNRKKVVTCFLDET